MNLFSLTTTRIIVSMFKVVKMNETRSRLDFSHNPTNIYTTNKCHRRHYAAAALCCGFSFKKSKSSPTTTIIVNNIGLLPIVFLLIFVKSIGSSLTLPTMGRGGSGTLIDMDPSYYHQQQQQQQPQPHPHRHSRMNNLIIKALNNNNNNNYKNVASDNNVYQHSSTNSDSFSSSFINYHNKNNLAEPMQVLYANGVTESTLPECTSMSVCNKIETYDKPWVEKQCKCPNEQTCSSSVSLADPYSLYDKTRQYKLCEPVRQLAKCRYFRDVTWTILTRGDNVTSQVVHCQCPKDSVAYIIKRGVYHHHSTPTTSNSNSSEEDNSVGFKYSFACSPISRMLCQRKEPCRLFTLKRRSNHSVTDVNSNVLCQCPKGFTCPAHHLDAGVIRGKLYPENSLRTYSGYCV